jgi:hypothetical protein
MTTMSLTTPSPSEWLLPCPVCDGPMYVYAWRTDGWSDCTEQHRQSTDPLTYERARRKQREGAPPAYGADRVAG